MKRTIAGFVISALVLVSLAFWALKGHFSGNIQEILMAGIVLVLVGGGILGMAVIFLFCWLGVKALGMKNE
jgi:hypothetical protein